MTFAVPNAYEVPDEEGWREKLPALPSEIEVAVGTMPMNEMHDGARIMELVGGGVQVDFDPEKEQSAEQPLEFDDNLAESMSEGDLSGIAAQIEMWVEADVESRSAWHKRLADGLKLLGVVHEVDTKGPFKLTEKVNHPAIAEAVVQFQARASAELLPPKGPAKALVLGEKTPEIEEQAERVADYLNYQLMVLDEDYFPEMEKLLFTLSPNGSQFKKVYRDELRQANVSRWIRGEDLIVPYGATTLQNSPRFTHQTAVSRNDLRKLQVMGVYRDVDLMRPSEGPNRDSQVQETKDKAQGQDNAGALLLDETDHTVWECNCDYDLPGFEDEAGGEKTGIALPYIITVEKDSSAVLSIRRNWKEDDQLRKKRVNVVHYPYLPGEGFYSYGLIHFLGGAGQAATGLLQTVLLGAAFAGLNGGFKSKDARLPSDVTLEYGVWKDTEMSAEELAKCFYTPNFKGPSEADFKILGLIQDAVQRFGSTTESMVGDASNTGPVGTTVALIEQGSKVFSGIHKRLHFAQGQELKLLAELNGQYLPAEGYPYSVHGASRQIFAQDFDERIDVLPVSDPNIFSSTQRIAIAQGVAQRADLKPGLYDTRKVEAKYLQAMGIQDPDEVLMTNAEIPRMDPVTENAMLLVGRPVRAFPDQYHEGHIALVMSQVQQLEAEGSPIFQQVAPAHLAHVAEHMAYAMRNNMARMMGITLPPLDLRGEPGKETEALDPQIENMLAQRAAQAISQLPQPGQQGAQQKAQQSALEQQAQALQQQAAELEEMKRQLEAQGSAVEKEKMRLEFAKREGLLREKMARMQQEAKGRDVAANVKAITDEAVRRVEAAIGKVKGSPQGAR